LRPSRKQEGRVNMATTENGLAEEGQRLHPLGLIIGFITGLPQLFFPIIAVIFGSGSRDNPAWIPLIIATVMLVSLFFRWVAWLRTHYHIGEDDIRIERGIISRTARSIPYDRIQDVSVEQKPLARLFALGEVKFETGGGEGEDAKLSFVSLEDAERLRDTVRARKAGQVAHVEQAEVDAPPVFAMDAGRLLTLGFYSFSLVILAVLGGLAQQFDFLLPFDWWDFKHWIGMAEENGVDITHLDRNVQIGGALFVLGGLVVVGMATGIIRTFLKEYGFRLDRTAKGFRRRRGLLTLTDVVMPVARVQAAIVETGPIRKRSGWHALKFVSLASESKEDSDHMVAPLAKLDEIWPIMAETGINPPTDGLSLQQGRFAWWLIGFVILMPIVFAAMFAVVTFADSTLTKSLLLLLLPLFLLVFSAFQWRVYRYAEDGVQIFARQGWWRQRLTILPQVRVQSAEIKQGPFARWVGLASLHFGIAGGTLELIALPLETARAIRDRVIAVVAPVDFSEINRRG
jgi:putative membrane protein